MKPAVARRSRSLKFAITPMIDIVFLLIIFFLVATHFVKSETLETVNLPEASQAEDPETISPRRMTITILSDGSYLLAGRKLPWSELEAILLQVEKPRTADDPEQEVRIRGDAAAEYRFIKPILETCAKANLRKVSFTVVPGEE
ncbi:biopolymer transporter ExbD [uncultured Rubinisphaera sp.]|uniref:ExbD/TolR family protein n=1 Tax=uncultured Rubinisphaera sp. TaxID=1678686 RepID=UPI0030D6EF7F